VTAKEIIDTLGMSAHPEGGWYVETFRDARQTDGRSMGTAIYYLLKAGERSHWHKVDATEIWHFHAGAPLRLGISHDGKTQWKLLGLDLPGGERPQIVIPENYWQSAESTGDWTLVGCTVSPGFEFSGFEMAPPGFDPESED